MSIVNYTKDLIMFNSYEISVLKLLINELDLLNKEDFYFLNEIDIDKIEFYWYKDSNNDNLGGFHLLSNNCLYINRGYFSNWSDSSYMSMMNQIVSAFPTIVHELCHCWQFNKNKFLYILLQFPFVRNLTIEKQAYRISDWLYDNNFIEKYSPKQIVELKKEYNFPPIYYDDFEKRYLD